MGATSVTGVGPGDSNGKWKCGNQYGGCKCGCGEETTTPPKVKFGCYTKYSGCSTAKYKSGGATRIKTC